MSDVLARIRVKETHGIRRFLYPLSAIVELPTGIDPQKVSLADSTGQGVPAQITPWHADNHRYYRLDFAVFLDPLASLDLTLYADADPVEVNDPLHIREEDGLFHSRQERFLVDFGWSGAIESVVYDGVSHLRGPSKIIKSPNGPEARLIPSQSAAFAVGRSLCARVEGRAEYASGQAALTTIETTACKSWITITLRLQHAGVHEGVVFELPVAATSSSLTYDLGIGNNVYGRLQAGEQEEVIWHTVFGEEPYAQWSVTVGGRKNYIGSTATAQEYLAQRWFHLVDSDKALAVAITQLPSACKHLAVLLKADGTIRVVFELEGNQEPVVEFGVCYHFLNDVPAIAAATNPQSILLPPTVEVLGA